MAHMGQAAAGERADAEPMARIQDLLPEDVRLALADLAAPRQPAATDDLGDDLPQHVDDRGGWEGRAREERRPASPSQQNHRTCAAPVKRAHSKPRAFANVVVMRHARESARERFPGFKAARIVDEVHAALVAGRLSAGKPPGMIAGRGDFPHGLYAWTEDGERIYGIMHGEDCFAVHTTMRRE